MTSLARFDLLTTIVRRRGVCLGGEWFGAPELGRRVGDRVYAVLAPRQTDSVAIFDAKTACFTCWAHRVPVKRSEVRHA